MPATPKKISFDDIRVGDTIRVVDVRDIKVTEASPGYEVRCDGGGAVLRDSRFRGATRTFQLIDRPIPALPLSFGSVIEVAGEVYLLRNALAFPGGLWQGAGGKEDVFTNTEMRNRAESENGFEVIR